MAQWNYPVKDDWTHDVKKDLIDFDIKLDLDLFLKKCQNKLLKR